MKTLKAKIDAGFPAKPHLYKPKRDRESDVGKFIKLYGERGKTSKEMFEKKLREMSEESVWVPVKFSARGMPTRFEYRIKAGEDYEVFCDSPSEELFEIKGVGVSGHPSGGDKLEREKISKR